MGVLQNSARRSETLSVAVESESAPDIAARTDVLSYTLQRAVYLPQQAMVAVADSVGSFFYGATHAGALKLRVDELESQVERMSGYRERIVRLESEITRLRDLQKLPISPGRAATPADIVGYFPSEHRIMLNLGRSRGIKPGSAVVASSGLVGQVVEATPTSSYVNLLTHPDFAVGARVARNISQEAGIANGQGGTQLMVTIYNEKADVQVGDPITTSGLSNVYPEGIAIGRVTWLDTNKNLGIRQALVQPAVNLAKIRQVVVLAK